MRDKNTQKYLVAVEMHDTEELPDTSDIEAAIEVYLKPWSDVKVRKVNVKENLEVTYEN